MKHLNLTVQEDRAVRQGQSEQGEDRASTTAVQCETHHRGSCSQSRSIQEPMKFSSRGNPIRRYGHQEETLTTNIESETAEVESISSDMASECRQPVQMAQFLQKEIDTQDMNIVVTALTTGIDAAVSQAQQTAQQQFQPQAQPQQFQTTFDDEQSLESETDQHRGEQDRQRHCRQQSGKVR